MSMNITVGCKVEREVADKLKAEAERQEVGVNHILRKMIHEHLNEPTFDDAIWGGGGLYDDMLDEISGKLGKDAGWLVSVMQRLVDGGYLSVGDNGEIFLNGNQIG